MSGYISRSIAHNDLYPELFVEPFAGGASVSMAQLSFNLVECIALVDRDPLIASFWQTVFFDTDWLVDQVWKTEITLEKWERLRRQTPLSVRQRAFKCLYLNRTSFSGVLAPSAGPIGGKTQKSKYKIDCRFTKETLIKRIRRVSEYHDRVALVWNLHWRRAVSRIQRMQQAGSLPKSALFYFDPPFYKKADALYTFSFKHTDHVALRDFLFTFDQPWILSYDFCPEVISLYRDGGFRASNVNLIYTASQKGEHGIGKELIVSKQLFSGRRDV
jgi:DNA adenine methylase